MTTPARPDSDPDLVISDALTAARRALAAPARGEGLEAAIVTAASGILADVINACAVAEGFASYADSDWSVPRTNLHASAVERIRAALSEGGAGGA